MTKWDTGVHDQLMTKWGEHDDYVDDYVGCMIS